MVELAQVPQIERELKFDLTFQMVELRNFIPPSLWQICDNQHNYLTLFA